MTMGNQTLLYTNPDLLTSHETDPIICLFLLRLRLEKLSLGVL